MDDNPADFVDGTIYMKGDSEAAGVKDLKAAKVDTDDKDRKIVGDLTSEDCERIAAIPIVNKVSAEIKKFLVEFLRNSLSIGVIEGQVKKITINLRYVRRILERLGKGQKQLCDDIAEVKKVSTIALCIGIVALFMTSLNSLGIVLLLAKLETLSRTVLRGA